MPQQLSQSLEGPSAQTDWRKRLYFPIRGNVISVYTLDDEKNHSHVAYCDVQLWGGYPMVSKVWIGRSGFRQETKRPAKTQRWRNATEPYRENGTNGWAQSLLPGDLVLVQFVEGDFNQPFISHHWPASNQGRESEDHPHGGGYPFNQQSRYRVKEGKLVEEVARRLDATRKDTPQWTWMYNGAFVEILNDGTLLLQSSNTQSPFIPDDRKDLGIEKSPDPTGDLVMSTRGAKQGDLVLTTGKSDKLDKVNARGNVLVLVYQAKEGNVVINTDEAEQGHILSQSSRKNTSSQIFLRAADVNDYAHISKGLSEVSNATEVALRCKLVSLGRRDAPKNAVTWQELTQVMTELCLIYDTHIHPEMKRGDEDSTLPVGLQGPYFETAKVSFKSEVVKLELNHRDDDPKKPRVDMQRGLSGTTETESDATAPEQPPPKRPGTPPPYGVWQ